MKHKGECHCGKVKVSFETEREPSDLGVRTCQCGFCKRHGAHSVSDPQGEVVIDGAADDIVRYRFGLRTADFIFCRHCGVYCATVTGEGEDKRASINITGLAIGGFSAVEETPVRYDSETREERIARRARMWTPARFVDPALNASSFGPH